MFKKILIVTGLVAALVGCAKPADVISSNLSVAADNFEVNRRVIFYNGITGDYMLQIEGLCSLGNNDAAKRLTVTCKTSPTTYKKHFLGLSDNVTFFVEQLEPNKANANHYRVIFKPSVIVPDLEIQ